MPYATLEDYKKLLGNTCSFEDDEEKWEDCNVPFGSEGSIQFSFWSNPNLSHLAAFTVAIFGDLRDFGQADVPEIKEWFEKVTKAESAMVRSAILEIEVEGSEEPIILLYKSK